MTILDAVNAVMVAATGLLLAPIAVFTVECLAALLFARRAGAATPDADGELGKSPRTAVLIPAHDEQAVIAPTLQAILATLAPGDRLLVVADNCTDSTADLARRSGAEVVERCDSDHRGKGYALQCGIAAISVDPPDVLVVIDADCLVEPRTIRLLARRAAQTQRPVQARNLTEADPWGLRNRGPTGMQAVSVLANRFTNLIRPLGLARLGGPCRLTGTGMAFPWRLAADMQLAGGSLVEDMQLGIDLAMRGETATFCPEAGVLSSLPVAGAAFAAQRTRWEQGHLRTAVRQVPRLLWTAMRRHSWPLLAMAADLSVPPLALLAALWLATAAMACLVCVLGGPATAAMLAAGSGAAMAVSIGLGWAIFSRRQVPLRALAAVPFYLLRKLPIYARMLVHRQEAWVRTERSLPPPVHFQRAVGDRSTATSPHSPQGR
ncbi:MAG: glycosyltransferase family 2 protein [Planctomycetaceae bacterium]|nr:glycosyltransferase family 2 protein [Planctomycetaceae bacterium]